MATGVETTSPACMVGEPMATTASSAAAPRHNTNELSPDYFAMQLASKIVAVGRQCRFFL